jgi:uncharacterized zinc-type alcohol dehydrogenase-like protein
LFHTPAFDFQASIKYGERDMALTFKTAAYGVQNATTPVAPMSIDRREPGPHDVLIDIEYCGICHSDIHQARNEWGGGSLYPMVPGHEIVGRVSKVGDHVTKFKLGQLVGVGCLVDSCRHCEDCGAGEEQYCNGSVFTYNSKDPRHGGLTFGGYAERITVDENFVVSVPENWIPKQLRHCCVQGLPCTRH